MLNTLKATRTVIIKHIIRKVIDDQMDVDASMRLIIAFDEEIRKNELEKVLSKIADKLRSKFSIDENEEYWLSYKDFESVIDELEEELRGEQG